ncbi:MAG: AarF/UbiB family protein, partial [Gemmatimonadales bacterium]
MAALGRVIDLGALGADLAWARARSGDPAAVRRVADRLATLRGLPQKIGQIIALTELDQDAGAFESLTEGPPGLAGEAAAALVEAELGRPVPDLFDRFDPVGIGASLGQVHRARTRDGLSVAVKIRYPGAAAAVEQDLGALNWLTWPFGGLSRFDLQAYRVAVGRMLRRELDYRAEAASLRRFGELGRRVPGVEVPVPVPALSTGEILTMSWIDGSAFRATETWGLGARVAAGKALLEFFLRGLLEFGTVHADPHPGNLRFRLDGGRPVVGLLDFGCTADLDRPALAAARWFFREGLDGLAAPADYLAAYAALGFRADLLDALKDRLPIVTAALLAPFGSGDPIDLRAGPGGPALAELLGEHRMNFRAAGPPALIYLIRAWHGTMAYVRGLGAPFAWRPVLEGVLADLPAAEGPL